MYNEFADDLHIDISVSLGGKNIEHIPIVKNIIEKEIVKINHKVLLRKKLILKVLTKSDLNDSDEEVVYECTPCNNEFADTVKRLSM